MRGLRPAVNRLIDHFCSERYSACGLPVIDREPPRWAHPNEVPRALDVPVDDPKPEMAMSKARLWRSRSAASIATIGPSTLTYLWRGFCLGADSESARALQQLPLSRGSIGCEPDLASCLLGFFD